MLQLINLMLLNDFGVLNYVLVVFKLSKIDYLSFYQKFLKLHFILSGFNTKKKASVK